MGGGLRLKMEGRRWRRSSPDNGLTLPLDLLFAFNAAVAVVITAADVTV